MAKRILVPLDGSSLAATALSHAISIVPPEEAQITLLRVVERQAAMAGGVDPLDWHLQRSEAQTYLEQTRDRLQEYLPAPPETVLLEGQAAERIVEHARHEGYDFLVFTSHGRGGLTGWNMSSVASKIAVRAVMSIMLVRPSTSTAPADGMLAPVRYRRILVPLDGSQRAEHVLPMASALAESHGADLVLLHVVVRPELIQRMPLTEEESELVAQVTLRNRCQAEEYFEQLGSRLAVQPERHILLEEDVAGTLHRFVADQSIDLVVLSAHGYTGHRQWAYGSLVTSFLTHGTTSLLILQDMPWQTSTPAEAEFTTQTWKEEGLLASHLVSNFRETRTSHDRFTY